MPLDVMVGAIGKGLIFVELAGATDQTPSNGRRKGVRHTLPVHPADCQYNGRCCERFVLHVRLQKRTIKPWWYVNRRIFFVVPYLTT